MTTIVSDGKTAAADSSLTRGHRVLPYGSTQKLIERDGLLYGLTGSIRMLEPLIAWYRAGANPKDKPTSDKEDTYWFMVFYSDCVIDYDETGPYPDRNAYPYTNGSGADFAKGALAAAPNTTPFEAVRVAALCDVYTDGHNISVHTVPNILYSLPSLNSLPSPSGAQVSKGSALARAL